MIVNTAIPSFEHLRTPYEDLSPSWQMVADKLKLSGYSVAAEHLGDIMRHLTPQQFFAKWGTWR